MHVLQLLNELRAAAIAFERLQRSQALQHVIVFNFGGGTFDVSLLKIEKEKFRVIATRGDCHLGGRDIDQALANDCIKRFNRDNGSDLSQLWPEVKQRAFQKVMTECEKKKQFLSKSESVEIYVDSVWQGKDMVYAIDRKVLSWFARGLFDGCVNLVQQVLTDAHLRPKEIDEIILIGRSSRIPMVNTILEKFFGEQPYQGVDPQDAVALGASLVAAKLKADDMFDFEDLSDLEFYDISP